jgi:hypothetical protein
MIPRAMSEIFKRAEAKRRESGSGASWDCRLSFLELYNEVRIRCITNSGRVFPLTGMVSHLDCLGIDRLAIKLASSAIPIDHHPGGQRSNLLVWINGSLSDHHQRCVEILARGVCKTKDRRDWNEQGVQSFARHLQSNSSSNEKDWRW